MLEKEKTAQRRSQKEARAQRHARKEARLESALKMMIKGSKAHLKGDKARRCT